MRDEIRKVLEMTKTGAISEEQGSELIEALLQKGESGEAASPRAQKAQESVETGLGATISEIVRGAVASWQSSA
ncbi:MAG: hypothetical protein ACXWP5_11455, partial [Bdellovibrionota bacterium]